MHWNFDWTYINIFSTEPLIQIFIIFLFFLDYPKIGEKCQQDKSTLESERSNLLQQLIKAIRGTGVIFACEAYKKVPTQAESNLFKGLQVNIVTQAYR